MGKWRMLTCKHNVYFVLVYVLSHLDIETSFPIIPFISEIVFLNVYTDQIRLTHHVSLHASTGLEEYTAPRVREIGLLRERWLYYDSISVGRKLSFNILQTKDLIMLLKWRNTDIPLDILRKAFTSASISLLPSLNLLMKILLLIKFYMLIEKSNATWFYFTRILKNKNETLQTKHQSDVLNEAHALWESGRNADTSPSLSPRWDRPCMQQCW